MIDFICLYHTEDKVKDDNNKDLMHNVEKVRNVAPSCRLIDVVFGAS